MSIASPIVPKWQPFGLPQMTVGPTVVKLPGMGSVTILEAILHLIGSMPSIYIYVRVHNSSVIEMLRLRFMSLITCLRCIILLILLFCIICYD